MTTLLEKALENVVVLSQDEQDAIASQILASLGDEDVWKSRLTEKRDVIRRMALEDCVAGRSRPTACPECAAPGTSAAG